MKAFKIILTVLLLTVVVGFGVALTYLGKDKLIVQCAVSASVLAYLFAGYVMLKNLHRFKTN